MPKKVKAAKKAAKKVKAAKKAAKKVKTPKEAAKKVKVPQKEKESKKVEMTAKLFVELSQKMIHAIIPKLVERVTTPEEDMNQVMSELQQEVGKSIMPEGLTMEDMGNYGRARNSDIEAYLKTNPKIKAQMDKLEKEFEAAMHPEQKTPTEKVELTPKLYIDLTLKMLPLLMNHLDTEFKKHEEELKASPEKALEIFLEIMLNIRKVIGEDILPEGITDEDMEQYKQNHEAEIEAYFEQHPEIKTKLDELQKEFEAKFPQ